MTLKRKIAIATGIGLFVFILLNPSIRQFKDYVGSGSYIGLKRTNNCFVFSIYKDQDENEYVGTLSNFFPITDHNSANAGEMTNAADDMTDSSTSAH